MDPLFSGARRPLLPPKRKNAYAEWEPDRLIWLVFSGLHNSETIRAICVYTEACGMPCGLEAERAPRTLLQPCSVTIRRNVNMSRTMGRSRTALLTAMLAGMLLSVPQLSMAAAQSDRSEERRVGKESRSRWSP